MEPAPRNVQFVALKCWQVVLGDDGLAAVYVVSPNLYTTSSGMLARLKAIIPAEARDNGGYQHLMVQQANGQMAVSPLHAGQKMGQLMAASRHEPHLVAAAAGCASAIPAAGDGLLFAVPADTINTDVNISIVQEF